MAVQEREPAVLEEAPAVRDNATFRDDVLSGMTAGRAVDPIGGSYFFGTYEEPAVF